jgi:hypothetical protein
MAKSWAGAGRDGIEESSFLYVTFTIQEPVSRHVDTRSNQSELISDAHLLQNQISVEVQGILAAYSDGIICIIRPV